MIEAGFAEDAPTVGVTTLRSYSNNGTAVNSGTISTTVVYPTGMSAGDRMILVMLSRYPANPPSTPAGWTFIGSQQGGSGAAGADSGEVLLSAYYKDADGTESGSLAVSVPSGNALQAVIYAFYKQPGDTWEVPTMTGGADTSVGTSVSVTGATDLNWRIGDWVLGVLGINTDLYSLTLAQPTYPGISTSGPSASSIAPQQYATGQGDDMLYAHVGNPVSGGQSTAAPTWTQTASGTAGSAPAGAGVFFRIRATTPAPVVSSVVRRLLLLGAG